MRKFVPWLVLVSLLVAAFIFRADLLQWGTAAWQSLTRTPEPPSQDARLVVSGVIEARQPSVAAQSGGRIVELAVAEGERVEAGEVVARLDASLLDARLVEAAAAVEVAEAQLAALLAGAREADVDVARAGAEQARAAASAARIASKDAQALIMAPGQLDVEIARAAAALAGAEEGVVAAEASARAADLEQGLWARMVGRLESGADVALPPQLGGGTRHVDAPAAQLAEARLQWNLASQAAWAAHARQATAVAEREAARQALADLQARQRDPVELRGQAATAAAAAGVADAAVEAAEAGVPLVSAGATAEQVATAEAAVAQAEAARAALKATRGQYEIRAPQAGVIADLILKEGEVARAGAPVARLADPAELTVTVYVPEPRLGEVRSGQAAAIRVDAFPGRSFQGTVRTVANEAEFTPKNVLSREDRASTVYAVTIAVPNPDGALRAGMPVDAVFCEDGACAFPTDAAEGADPQAGVEKIVQALNRAILKRMPAQAPAQRGRSTRYYGSIESDTVTVAAETGGRASEVTAVEGDSVSAGQALVLLEGDELAAQRAEVEAAIRVAEAELARVSAPAQAERVTHAAAGVRQAEAAVGAAQARLDAAKALREKPQELDSRINATRREIESATAAVDAAQAAVKSVQVLQESLDAPGSDEDKTRRAVYDAQAEAAAAALRAAQVRVQGAQQVLARLLAIRQNPVALDAAVRAAEGALGLARAEANTARARLAQVEAPPQPAQVDLARARVSQARAALATVDAALEKLQVRSPLTGRVVTRSILPGEVVVAGAPLLTLADEQNVRLKVYVPMSDLGTVQLGKAVQVTVDAYPGRTFTGKISRIGEQAEYTPQNIQTEDERARTVVAVEVSLPNADGALRAGMAAGASW